MDDREDGYRGPTVCSIVGITYRQLDYWARTDLIRPSVADAAGSGTQRLYGYRDLIELKLIKSLLDSGLSLQRVRKILTYLREELGEDVPSASLVVNGSRSLLVRTGEELIDLMQQGQGVFNVVGLDGVVGEVDAAIHQLRPTGDLDDATGSDATGVVAAR